MEGVDGTDAGGYHLPSIACHQPWAGEVSSIPHPSKTDIDRWETHVLPHRGEPGKPQTGYFDSPPEPGRYPTGAGSRANLANSSVTI